MDQIESLLPCDTLLSHLYSPSFCIAKELQLSFNFGNCGDFGNPRRVTAYSIRPCQWRG